MRIGNIIVAVSMAASASATAQSRGELLYTTHCIACHSTEVHWRDKRSASDWASLAVQVRRWQEAASLAWSETDIREVSRYLNESIYHFERTADLASFLSQRSHVSVFPARQGPHQL